MKVVVPNKIAVVVVLEEFGEISADSNGEDQSHSHPEWTVQVGVDSLKKVFELQLK